VSVFERISLALDWINPLAMLLDIRVAETGIDFLTLRSIRVASVPYQNIEFVQKQTNLVRPFTAYRCVNRCGPRYVIHKKVAWFSKYVVVTPFDGSSFERALRHAGVAIRQ